MLKKTYWKDPHNPRAMLMTIEQRGKPAVQCHARAYTAQGEIGKIYDLCLTRWPISPDGLADLPRPWIPATKEDWMEVLVHQIEHFGKLEKALESIDSKII